MAWGWPRRCVPGTSLGRNTLQIYAPIIVQWLEAGKEDKGENECTDDVGGPIILISATVRHPNRAAFKNEIKRLVYEYKKAEL